MKDMGFNNAASAVIEECSSCKFRPVSEKEG